MYEVSFMIWKGQRIEDSTRSQLPLTCQQVGEQKVSEVVRLHSQLQLVLRELTLAPVGNSSVVDQDVESLFLGVDLLGEPPDGGEGGEVELAADHVLVTGRCDDLLCD